jgi:uncharacterized membrane protein (UPF0127 family)
VTPSRRAVGAVVGAALVVAVLFAIGGDDVGGDDSPRASALATRTGSAGPATAPFAALTETSIRVGQREIRVVVADDVTERTIGLRGRVDASPYDGMLFVFDDDTETAFTMSGVPAPLRIAFFAADGSRVDVLRMEPCAGSDATCPLYRASGAYRYALETAAAAMPPGRLRAGSPTRR